MAGKLVADVIRARSYFVPNMRAEYAFLLRPGLLLYLVVQLTFSSLFCSWGDTMPTWDELYDTNTIDIPYIPYPSQKPVRYVLWPAPVLRPGHEISQGSYGGSRG
jgi:hypothetical protein